MGQQLHFYDKLHTKTKRDYLTRISSPDIVEMMQTAKQFDFDYWDGDRKYGFGGYHYDGRWKGMAEDLIERYQLTNQSKILDVGCGKAFLLFELKQLLPGVEVVGFDVSRYAISKAPDEIKPHLFVHKAEDRYPFGDKTFDLVLSLTVVHHLKIYEVKRALQEIERVGKHKYITLDSYRNDQELYHLKCWTLTCESFFRPEEWIWLFEEYGYTGDYDFLFFE